LEEKYQQLLDKQIAKLDDAEFDLEAWKSGAMYIISIIFGPKDPKIKAIDDLKIEYSSWTLRDSNPDRKPIETCKKQGKEILQIAKEELEIGGLRNTRKTLVDKLKTVLNDRQLENFNAAQSAKERKKILKGLNKSQLIDLLNSLFD